MTSYCVALLEKLKHILDEVKLDNDFPYQAIRLKLARGKSQLEIWIGFLNEVSEHRVERYVTYS